MLLIHSRDQIQSGSAFIQAANLAMEMPTSRYGGLNCARKCAIAVILSFCMFSQECVANGHAERGQDFARRKLLQGDAPMGGAPPMGYATSPQIVVDANGLGDYTTVQDAVDAVPPGNPQKVVIRISAGNYV